MYTRATDSNLMPGNKLLCWVALKVALSVNTPISAWFYCNIMPESSEMPGGFWERIQGMVYKISHDFEKKNTTLGSRSHITVLQYIADIYLYLYVTNLSNIKSIINYYRWPYWSVYFKLIPFGISSFSHRRLFLLSLHANEAFEKWTKYRTDLYLKYSKLNFN